MSADSVRLLIVDDHPVFRKGLAALLAHDSEVDVIGEAASGAEAITLAAELMPDVILMDISMPDVDGVTATRQITAASPHVAVLMLTMLQDDESVFAAMRAGARGYLLKEAEHADVLRAVLAAADGEAVFGAAVAGRVLAFFASASAETSILFPDLTEREREVLDLLARGRNNARIAKDLTLTQKTVRNHVYNIFAKLQVCVADRAEAIIRARDAGLGVEPSPWHGS